MNFKKKILLFHGKGKSGGGAPPSLCVDSIGGADGTEYKINGALANHCVIFKQI